MNSLILGFHTIFPIFFIIAIGYFAKRKNFLDEAFVDKSTWLVFYIALPFKLFLETAKADAHSASPRYIAFLLLGTTGAFFLIWFIASFFIKNKRKLAAFVHCSYRSNFVFVGLPLLESIYPNASTSLVVITVAFALILYNVLATIILTYYGEKKCDKSTFLLKIAKNPMIIAIMLGLFANFINFNIFGPIEDGMRMMTRLATPLSLVLIGASLRLDRGGEDFGIIFGSAFLKDIGLALIFMPLGILFGLSDQELAVSYIFWATPCAINCFIMTKQMGGDYEIASKIITTSFLLSIFTFSIGIAFLKTIGIL